MLRNLTAALATVIAITLAPTMSQAGQPSSHPQMEALHYLIGTWHCHWHSGSHFGIEDQVFTPALDGAWLEEKEIVNVNGVPTVNTIHYTGYDPQTKSYVHLGPDADGSFELAQSPDGETWKSADGTLVHHRISDTERELSETAGTGASAAQVTMTCTK